MKASVQYALAVAAAMAAAAPAADAQILVGNTPFSEVASFEGSGNVSRGGATWDYTILDPDAWSSVYWTIAIMNPYSNIQSSSGQMAFQGFFSEFNTFVWRSTENLLIPQASGPAISVATLFVLQVLSPVPVTYSTAASLDIGGVAATHPFLNVSGLSSFSVHARLVEENSGTGIRDFWDATTMKPAGSSINTSFQGGFYATAVPPTVVPEPLTMILLGTGLAGVGALRRRRRKDLLEEV
jgi:hypothetical protein